MKPVTVAIAGAGGRGKAYARYIETHPEEGKIVGVAEPTEARRKFLADIHKVDGKRLYADWRDMVKARKFADAVIIATQDHMHVEPALAFARKGYHILLEKPMAPDQKDCRRVVNTAKKAGVIFAVCHVLRYTRYTRTLKRMIDSGEIGEVVSLDHLEPVGYWHQAHSFVRGNWRNEAQSSPMLLQKSCHDLDWISYVMGARCERVSSFGSLKHFRKQEKPAGAGMRCLDCAVEPNCPYSAVKIYLGRVRTGYTGWPLGVLTDKAVNEENLAEVLRTGPYGRCVYECDNDVVDHQVVSMEFAGGKTASFTMTAFTEMRDRETRIFGTRGELHGNGKSIRKFDFMTDTWTETDTYATDGTPQGGHGGGDAGVMESWLKAVRENDQTQVVSGPDQTLASHLMVFAAEKSRRTGKVVIL